MLSELVLHNLTFTYESSPTPLFEDLTLHLSEGWTGVVGPNGSGKTTFLLLAVGVLKPTRGRLLAPTGVYCSQRTDDPPDGLGDLLASDDPGATGLRARLGLGQDWVERWATLSHGERKRAQIAEALAASPGLLAVDEPTNHLDGEARDLLASALERFRGVGVLVSHDRELLDRLCRQCLFLSPPGATLRPGGYTAGAEVASSERAAARRRYLETRRKAQALHREAVRRRQEASRADRKKSKRHIARHDTDAKGKIDLAIFTGKDGQAGRLSRQLESRERRVEEEVRASYAPAERVLKFWMPGSGYRGDCIARLPARPLPLGNGRRLLHPLLELRPADRVALTGPNGSGKSTLVRELVEVASIPRERMLVMPQEIDARESLEIVARLGALDSAARGRLMTVVAGLGSEPERLLATGLPSPGETRKLLLALGVLRDPWLIVMDEPTNHLDLPSIELLERALAECPSALLLVSHDTRFLSALGSIRWRTRRDGADWRLVL